MKAGGGGSKTPATPSPRTAVPLMQRFYLGLAGNFGGAWSIALSVACLGWGNGFQVGKPLADHPCGPASRLPAARDHDGRSA